MALVSGARLGPYEILSPLGSGGMGEVYRARDTKLNRDVALKILPDAFASDPDRLARFTREAQTLAALNHPNIAHIHGLEESGGVRALVMELVEGEDLGQRLVRGPIPLDEALPIAKQIAEALEAAHEQGIIHRDLKPANVKVRADGTVKVLDFGLAKAMEPAAGSSPSLSMSPTITTPAMTQTGVILGTAAYMSPEQARGKTVDKRTDIWAFGCVLYEMLTGKRAFEADDVSLTLAEVMKSEPNWTLLKALPPLQSTFLRQCLQKDPKQRLQAIGDMRLALEGAFETTALLTTTATSSTSRVRLAWMVAAAATAACLVGVGIGAGVWHQPALDPPPTTRFSLWLPNGQMFAERSPRMVSVSRDGSQFIYLANSQLYRRLVGDLQPTGLSGSLQWKPRDVVFAPDGRTIAFFSGAERAVMRVSPTGGTPTMIGRTETPLGISWDAGGIVVGQGRGGVLRFRVSDEHPPAERIVQVGEEEIAASPQLLRGGDAVLFTLAKKGDNPGEQWDKARVVIQSLATGERHTVVEGASDARYLPTGHLLYAVAGTVVAVAFDLRTSRVTGQPVTLVDGVRRSPETGVAQMATSDSGTLLYVPGARTWTTHDLRTFLVTDRTGATMAVPLPPGDYDHPRVSGWRLAYDRADQQGSDVWIYDFEGSSAPRRLTFKGRNRFPVWSPDGSRLALQSDRDGNLGIFVQDAGGATAPEPLTTAEAGDAHIPESWSPDGKHLLYAVQRGSRFTLRSLSVDDKKSTPFGDVVSEGGPPGAVFSPNGRWVAYAIIETVPEATSPNRGVFVQPFPATGSRYQVPNTALDYHPAWSPDGKTLFYNPAAILPLAAVTVRAGAGIFFERPVKIAPTSRVLANEARGYDILPDGRFVGVVPAPAVEGGVATDSPELGVVLNWSEELKRLVPAR
jgi:serine/threonine protein kinase